MLSIAGDEQLTRSLVLLVAVCEQTLVELEELSSPDPQTTDLVEQLRVRIYDLLDDRNSASAQPGQ